MSGTRRRLPRPTRCQGVAVDQSVMPIPPSIESPPPADPTDSVGVMYVDSAVEPGNQSISRVTSVELLLLDSAPNDVIVFGLDW